MFVVLATRFIVGLNSGLPAAVLVIMLRLWKIASLRSAQITPGEKRRDMIIDLSIGLGIPVLAMGTRTFSSCRYTSDTTDRR